MVDSEGGNFNLEMKEASVSIVIPCLNEEKYICESILSILNQGVPEERLEILIVDGGSTDNTLPLIQSLQATHGSIRVVHNPKKKTPFALNLGVENATKDLVLILSAHSKLSEGYIKVLQEEMIRLKADAVGGIMHTEVKNKTYKSLSIASVLKSKFGVGNSMFRVGVSEATKVDTVPFGLYKRELFSEVGAYDERLIRNHDMEFSKRLIQHKKSIYLTPKATCVYYARETFNALAKNNYGNGKWNILTVFITKKWESLSLRHFVPLFFVLSLIGPLLLTVLDVRFAMFTALSLFFYLTAVFFISFKINHKDTRWYYLVWSFITLHVSYGWGSLMGILSLPSFALKPSK